MLPCDISSVDVLPGTRVFPRLATAPMSFWRPADLKSHLAGLAASYKVSLVKYRFVHLHELEVLGVTDESDNIFKTPKPRDGDDDDDAKISKLVSALCAPPS